MPKMIFVNLPITDVARSSTFYGGLGFTFNPQFSDDSTASYVVSDTITIMLLTREKFAGFCTKPVGDPAKETSAIIAFSADSRAEVDAFGAAVLAGGGADNDRPQVMGDYMYGRSFSDPDGNVLEIMWMDVAAAMTAWGQA